jgi:hypothetical protein
MKFASGCEEKETPIIVTTVAGAMVGRRTLFALLGLLVLVEDVWAGKYFQQFILPLNLSNYVVPPISQYFLLICSYRQVHFLFEVM